MLLAGDIGGTNTDLAVFSSEKGSRAPLAQARFHSADYPGLEPMIREFLARAKLSENHACFGVPGPAVARILPALADGRVAEAFQRKGRLAELLARMPVHAITSRVALLGAASYVLRLARQRAGA